MSPVRAVLVDCGVWATWSSVVGLAAVCLPAQAFDPTRLPWRTFEGERHFYEKFGIRRWKDRLPDAGALFGGMPKRHLPSGSGRLERYGRETCRAELVHWLILLIYPVFVLWNTLFLDMAMVAYAVIANVPCIAIQRFNRARIRTRPQNSGDRTVRRSVL